LPVSGKTLLPELKILLYVVFVVLVSAVSSLKVYAVVFIALALCLFFLKVPFSTVRSGWIPIGIFLLFTFLSNLLNQHGKILFLAGPVMITVEGLNIAATRTLRVLFMITGAKLLIATSRTEEVIRGLWRLLSPFERLGLPVKDYFHTMGLTLKCFPILKKMLYENYREHIISPNIRGIWNRAKAISMFLLPMFVESVQNPEKFFIEPGPHEKTN
jgi:energy-coupling factor transport system permease protein